MVPWGSGGGKPLELLVVPSSGVISLDSGAWRVNSQISESDTAVKKSTTETDNPSFERFGEGFVEGFSCAGVAWK